MPSVWMLLVHLAWLPLLLVLFLKAYRGPHPFWAALLAYFLGSFMIMPAFGLQLIWRQFVPGDSMAGVLEMPLWLVPVEEGAKVFAALLAAWTLRFAPPRRSFLPLALAAALGFATAETGVALAEFGVEVLPLRVLVSIPGHLLFTSFAAAGLVGRPFEQVTGGAFLGWWLLSTLAHSAYNLVVLHDHDTSALVLFGWMVSLAFAAAALALARYRRSTKG